MLELGLRVGVTGIIVYIIDFHVYANAINESCNVIRNT